MSEVPLQTPTPKRCTGSEYMRMYKANHPISNTEALHPNPQTPNPEPVGSEGRRGRWRTPTHHIYVHSIESRRIMRVKNPAGTVKCRRPERA